MLIASLLICILIVFLTISVYYNIRFGIIILRMQDVVEDCLDELDQRYAIFAKILEKPVFFDSVEIRQVIQEIRASQELILKIANRLSDLGNSDPNEKIKQQDARQEE